MKRILLISSEFPPGPGGIGTHAYQLAKALVQHQYEVHVLSPQDYADESEIQAFNARLNFHITSLPKTPFKTWQSIERLIHIQRTLHQFNPDLIIASGGRAIWLSALFLRTRTIPCVVVGHGTEFGSRDGLGTKLTQFATNQASAVICVSHYTKKSLQALGVNKPPIHVIHNGADHTQFYPLPPAEVAGLRDNEGGKNALVLLTVGKVSDRKGQEVVIRALPIITGAVPTVQYWMAGLPQEQTKLEALAEQLGVRENIRFFGRVSQETLRKLYNACDIFVMTSRQLADGDFEGYGIAVIEAALSGKTAIVSDNSGLAEAVQDGVTGLLVPQKDPTRTAQAILKLAEDSDLRQQLAQQAYQNAVTHQTWEKVGIRYIEVLEEVFAEINHTQP